MEGTLCSRLVVDGFNVRTDGVGLVVSPGRLLTRALRAEIAEHKPELIAQTLFLGIWRDLEQSRERLPERPDGERWAVMLAAYERLCTVLGPEVTEQLELLKSGVAA